ncbi:CD151 antigen isoform X4 [Meles meles]|uniref:CD151 antigen isoform X4 n=1 Tax=Meles meles TaxID=9662 RepID=UPI001E699FC8|nr:CD151 antigen isoform X4 [Meles meles]
MTLVGWEFPPPPYSHCRFPSPAGQQALPFPSPLSMPPRTDGFQAGLALAGPPGLRSRPSSICTQRDPTPASDHTSRPSPKPSSSARPPPQSRAAPQHPHRLRSPQPHRPPARALLGPAPRQPPWAGRGSWAGPRLVGGAAARGRGRGSWAGPRRTRRPPAPVQSLRSETPPPGSLHPAAARPDSDAWPQKLPRELPVSCLTEEPAH